MRGEEEEGGRVVGWGLGMGCNCVEGSTRVRGIEMWRMCMKGKEVEDYICLNNRESFEG